MTCICGHEAKSVTLKCSVVFISTYHCSKCGRIVREFRLDGTYSRYGLIQLLQKVHLYNSREPSDSRKLVIDFLERTLDKLPEFQDQTKTTRQRLEDLRDRKFLKECLQEDYYT